MTVSVEDYFNVELNAEQAEQLVARSDLDLTELIDRHLWDGRVFMRRNAALVARLVNPVPSEWARFLAVATKDIDAVVREYAMLALGRVDGPIEVVLPPLLRGLTDRVDGVRSAARDSLYSLGPRRGAEMVPELIRALADGAPEVRFAASDLLAIPAAIEPLVEALIYPRAVRQLVIGVLLRLGDAAGDALLRALADPVRRDLVAQVLAQFSGIGGRHRTELERLATSEDAAVQRVAADLVHALTIGKTRAPVVIPTIPIDGWGTRQLLATDLDAAAASSVATDDLVLALRDGRSAARANAAGVLGRRAQRDDSLTDTLAFGLAVLVRDHDPMVRTAAIHALAALESQMATGPLVAALGDPELEVAGAARAHLDALGPKAAPWLLDVLRPDQSGAVHAGVVDALVGFGTAAVPALAAALETQSATAKEIAAAALERMGTTAVEAIPQLVRALGAQTDEVRRAAARALGAIAQPGEALLSALGEARRKGNRSVREAATQAILRLWPETTQEVDSSPITFAGFEERLLSQSELGGAATQIGGNRLELALGDGRSHVRHNAALALATLGAQASTATAGLTVCLRDADPVVRRAAAEALGQVAGGPDASAAVAALADAQLDADRAVARAAAAALLALGATAVAGLTAALDRDPELAAATVIPALKAHGKAAVESLLRAFDHPAVRVRANAAAALAELDRSLIEPARAALSYAVERDGEALVRRYARRALNVLDDVHPAPRALPAERFPIDGFEERELSDAELDNPLAKVGLDRILAALGDGRAVVRRNAAVACGRLGARAEGAVPLLLVRLRDGDSTVRRAVAEALGRSTGGGRTQSIVAGLVDALIDRDQSVRAAAGHALTALGKTVLPELVTTLDRDPAIAARTVLPQLASLEGDAVPALAAALEHDSVRIRANAANALALFPKGAAEAARTALAVAARDPNDAVRVGAKRALDTLDGGAVPFEYGPPEPLPVEGFEAGTLPLAALKKEASALEPEALRRLIFEGRAAVRENAARAFQLLGKRAAEGLNELLIALKDTSEPVQLAAIESLAALKLDAARVVPPLAGFLLHRSKKLQEQALAGVLAYGDDAVPPLLELLTDRPHRAVPIVSAVARAMPALLEPLIGKLAPAEPLDVRENVADICGQLGAKARDAMPALLAALEAEPEVSFRVGALRAIAQVATLTDELQATLIALRKNDKRFDVQNAAIAALDYLVRQQRRRAS